jgi:hypothetical protein
MMKSQFYASRSATVTLAWGEPLRIDGDTGELTVLSGRVWLTRENDPDDHVLEAGQSMQLASTDGVVVEPWRQGERTTLAWRPHGLPRRPEPALLPAAPADLGERCTA